MTTEPILDAAQAFFCAAFEGVIRIECTEGASTIWVDGRPSPPVISTDAPSGLDADFCLWRLDFAELPMVLAPGGKGLESNFVSGRLHISGDMAVMARVEVPA